jgi:hypothetical protein
VIYYIFPAPNPFSLQSDISPAGNSYTLAASNQIQSLLYYGMCFERLLCQAGQQIGVERWASAYGKHAAFGMG